LPFSDFFPAGLDFCRLINIITHRHPRLDSLPYPCLTTSAPADGNSATSTNNSPPCWKPSSAESPGSLYTLRRRCGKPSCHCAQGELHASTVLGYRGQGGPRNLTPTPEQLPAVQELTDEYRRFRQARTQLLRLQRQILTLIDRIEALRVEQGERRFEKLRSPSHPRSRR
jgi:hypothetical protein